MNEIIKLFAEVESPTLTFNNVIFIGIHHLQKIVCVMGTICTPNSANVFKGKFERT